MRTMSQLTLGVLAVAMLIACGQSSPNSSTDQDILAIYPNGGMKSASPDDPTGRPGDENVRIGLYTIQLPAGVVINSHALISRMHNPDDGSEFTLGHIAKNLRLRDEDSEEQIGSTFEVLGIVSNAPLYRDDAGYGLGDLVALEPIYGFIPEPNYGLDLELETRTITIGVYADLLPKASEEAIERINTLMDGVIIPVVSVQLPSGETQIIWVEKPMQKLYIHVKILGWDPNLPKIMDPPAEMGMRR